MTTLTQEKEKIQEAVEGKFFTDIPSRSDTSLLLQALIEAHKEMPVIKKRSKNSFTKSKYADIAAVITTARPILLRNGLNIYQQTRMHGNIILLVTTLMHSSGQSIVSEIPLIPVKKDDPQAMGSCLTYLKRYQYCLVAGIVSADEDDDGSYFQSTAKMSPNQVASLTHELSYHPGIQEALLQEYRVPSISEMPAKKYTNIMDKLQKIRFKKEK